MTYTPPTYDQSVDFPRDFKILAENSPTAVLLVRDSDNVVVRGNVSVGLEDLNKVFVFAAESANEADVFILPGLPKGFQFTVVTETDNIVSLNTDSEVVLGGRVVSEDSVAVATKIADDTWIVVAGGEGGFVNEAGPFIFNESILGGGSWYG
jgi:hypothetical protein